MLGKFLLYVACAGQQEAPLLGYSPLPKNLVQVVFEAINRINGHPPTPDLNTPQGVADCPNPTFSSGDGPRCCGAAPAAQQRSLELGPAATPAPAPASSDEQPRAGHARGVLDDVRRATQDTSTREANAPRARSPASRRTRARSARGREHVQAAVATRRCEWAALYVPILVFGPLLAAPTPRKRRLEVRRAAS